MGVPRVLVAPDRLQESHVVIDGQDHAHLARVLRIREGDCVILLNGAGGAYKATVIALSSGKTTLRIEEPAPATPEPSVSVYVAQSLGKGDRFEQVLQHGTEAGAAAFTPILADRCNVELPADRIDSRMVRWRAILKGAVEQCGRSVMPALHEPAGLRSWITPAVATGYPVVMLHEDPAARPLRAILASLGAPRRVHIAVGPEGGWSPGEREAAIDAGVTLGSLGPRILRTETAALVAVSQMLYHFDADSHPS
jgi:16S rRNA (uracil1498-N3)-methyltransferase